VKILPRGGAPACEGKAKATEKISRVASYPIFRTPRGQAWTHTSFCNKWQWLLKRPTVIEYCKTHGVDMKELKLYNFRHEFLSHWVDSGGDIYVAAQLCGTSVKMVEKRYGHPNIDRLHDKFLQYHATKAQDLV
jgi:site-specific recombinase XerD